MTAAILRIPGATPRAVMLAAEPAKGDVVTIDGVRWHVVDREHLVPVEGEATFAIDMVDESGCVS